MMDRPAQGRQPQRRSGLHAVAWSLARRAGAALLLGTCTSFGVALFAWEDNASSRIVNRQGTQVILSDRHFGWPLASLACTFEHQVSPLMVFPPRLPRLIDAIEGPNGRLVPTRINRTGACVNAATFAGAFLLISAIPAALAVPTTRPR